MAESRGELIKRLREGRQMTQLGLANSIGKTPGAVSQIETGKINPTRDTIEAIDTVLNADGAITSAYGFSSPTRAEWVPLEQHVELARKVDELTEQVLTLGAEVARLSRARRRDAR